MSLKSRQFIISILVILCSQINIVMKLIDGPLWFGVINLTMVLWFGREYYKSKHTNGK